MKIHIDDLEDFGMSIDVYGKVYEYKNRIIRIIHQKKIIEVRELLKSGLIKDLFEKKLFPETWISDIDIEGKSLILEHEKIEHWNYPYEWSFNMLKDAALTVLEINRIANTYGYELSDAHAYNVVFVLNKPQYIDLGSFIKIDVKNKGLWKSNYIFYSHFYIPLYLWSKGYADVARGSFLKTGYFSLREFFSLKHPLLQYFSFGMIPRLLYSIQIGRFISKEVLVRHFGSGLKFNLVYTIKKLLGLTVHSKTFIQKIKKLHKPIEHSMWSNYHSSIDVSKNKRFKRLLEIISDLKGVNSVVDLAANHGKFARLVAEDLSMKTVIATDYDSEAVHMMYEQNKEVSNMLPLLSDMVKPTGRIIDKSFSERIRGDVVIALAVTHHLVITQKIPLDDILKKIKKLSNKYVIIEFMPNGLYSSKTGNTPQLPEYYNYDWFKDSFKDNFTLIMDEEIDTNRHVFVGMC